MPNISFAGAKKRKTRHSGYVFKMSRQEPGSTQVALACSGLLSLVDELLLNIIDHIDNQDALCYLAMTCTRFQGLVEPYIWRNLLVLTGGHARRIMEALDSREERVDYIQNLSIRYKEDRKEGIEELNHYIALMSKLKHFTLESPCPNNDEWRGGLFFDGYSRIDYTNLLASAVYPRIGHPLALPMLQSREYAVCHRRNHRCSNTFQSRCMATVRTIRSFYLVELKPCSSIQLCETSHFPV
jgi:hypothetical protein